MTPLPIPKLLFDPKLLGTGWEPESFAAHRAFACGTWGVPMNRAQRRMWDSMTGGRKPLKAPPSTLVVIKSRRTGWSRLTASIGDALALQSWARAPGETPTIVHLSPDRDATRNVFGYAEGGMRASPLCSRELVATTADRLEFANGNAMIIRAANETATRSYTCPVVIVDECAYVPDLAGVLRAVRPSMATVPGAILLLVTTPRGASGPVFELDQKYYGVENGDGVLVIHAHYQVFHPAIAAFAERELKLDPVGAASEWLCTFSTGLTSLIDAPTFDRLVRASPLELPCRSTLADGTPLRYFAALDASGGRADAAAAAIAHNEDGKVVVDGVRRWAAPHDPVLIAGRVKEFLAGYALDSAVADNYGAEAIKSIYARAGVRLVKSELVRSDVYLRALPLMTGGAVEFPPDQVLRLEVLGLERRVQRTGRESVDHKPNQHDDAAVAVCLAAVAAAGRANASTGGTWSIPSDFSEVLIREGDYSMVHPRSILDLDTDPF